MKLQCPSCHIRLTVPEGSQGRTGRCPSCGAYFHVAMPGQVPVESATRSSDWDIRHGEIVEKPHEPMSRHNRQLFAIGDSDSTRSMFQLRIRDGRVFGPVDRSTLDLWFRENRIGPDCDIRIQGRLEWMSAANFYPQLRANNSPSAGQNPAGFPYQPQGWTLFGMSLMGLVCFLLTPITLILCLVELYRISSLQTPRIEATPTKIALVISGVQTLALALLLLASMS